jgi:3',5'-cyclic AMP phosphodiesterase CpdA
MPVYLIPGNHDRRENMRLVFGGDSYLPMNGEFLHYTVEDLPMRLIGLDTVVPGKGHGEMDARGSPGSRRGSTSSPTGRPSSSCTTRPSRPACSTWIRSTAATRRRWPRC